MKILVNSYYNFAQNTAGGVYSKVINYIHSAKDSDLTIKQFDVWNDKVIDYDIIHYFALKAEFMDQMYMAKKLGKKIVISSIVTIADAKKTRLKIKFGRHLHLQTNENIRQSMLQMADAIITETHKEKDYIVEAYGIDPAKIHVIPNGVSEEILDGDPELIMGKLGLTRPFVLQVGRFDSNKNQLSVIRALKDTDIPVVFVGGADSSAPNYFDQCKKEAGTNCYFTGWIKHSDPFMASAYAAAKVVVLPSHHEIFGNAIFEGAMTKSNIVATDVLPLEEFGFSKNAIAIDSTNITDIKEAIIKAYNKEIDEKFSDFVKEKYSLSAIFVQHLNIYKRL
ncbi:glycosyltransferase family 4 protein [Bacteroides nordii]|uniref:glycosyltransferase family 4 protein n=1 Tax=Bacteroides nordii TaxID=291645 RepID=UPI00248F6ACF|nr:glycosyltransferase family 4 protein [Bacteroides nordii]